MEVGGGGGEGCNSFLLCPLDVLNILYCHQHVPSAECDLSFCFKVRHWPESSVCMYVHVHLHFCMHCSPALKQVLVLTAKSIKKIKIRNKRYTFAFTSLIMDKNIKQLFLWHMKVTTCQRFTHCNANSLFTFFAESCTW